MDKEFVIRDPLKPVEEIPDNNKLSNSDHHTGFNIINIIIDIFTLKDSIGYVILKKYRKELKIKNNPYLYWTFVILFLTVDFIVALLVSLILILLLLIIIIVFAKGVGVTDFLIDLYQLNSPCK